MVMTENLRQIITRGIAITNISIVSKKNSTIKESDCNILIETKLYEEMNRKLFCSCYIIKKIFVEMFSAITLSFVCFVCLPRIKVKCVVMLV